MGAMKRGQRIESRACWECSQVFWTLFGILASNVGAPWKILIGPFAVWLFLSSLLQFLGTGLRRKG